MLAAVAVACWGCSPVAASPPVVEPALEIPRIDGGAAEAPTGGVRFGRVAPAVGARWRVLVRARSEVTATDALGKDLQLSEYASVYTVEIVAVDGPAPSRVRLVFERNAHSYQGVEKATAIDGKTYVLEATEPFVRDASGSAAPEEEAQRVLDVFPDLGTRTWIDQVLPDAPMRPGEERHDLAAAILRVIHPRAWTMNEGSAVLLRSEGPPRSDAEQAVFAIAIDATGRNGVRMNVKGEARIRVRDARLASIALDGTYVAGKDDEPGAFWLRREVRDLPRE